MTVEKTLNREDIFRKILSFLTWMVFAINFFYCLMAIGISIPRLDDKIALFSSIIIGVVSYFYLSIKFEEKIKKYICFLYAPMIITGIIMIVFYWIKTGVILETAYNVLKPESIVKIYGVGGLIYLLSRRQFSIKWGYLIGIVAYVITLYLYPVLEIILRNDGWTFASSEFIGLLFAFSIVLVILLFGLLSILGDKSEKVYLVLLMFSVCSYVQNIFLNRNLYMMDGAKQQWSISIILVNIVIWMILFGIVLLGSKFKSDITGSVLSFIAIMLICAQGAASAQLFVDGRNEGVKEQASSYLSTSHMYEVGKEKNIIYLLLDFYDTDYFASAIQEDSSIQDYLSDFVYYPDTVSQFSRTNPSVAYCLTQELDFKQMPFENYVNQAYGNSPFWQNINQSEYSYYLYSEEKESFPNIISCKAGNYIEKGYIVESKYSLSGMLDVFLKIGHYRAVPYLWKNLYLYTAEDINSKVLDKFELDYPMYTVDDASFYDELINSKLSVGSDDKRFTFIHLNGAHPPYTLSRDGRRVSSDKTSALEQYIGAMNIVNTYLEELRRMGVYDDSLIVVAADHGENYMLEELEQNTNPILLIKYPGAKSSSMMISDARVSQEDILRTIACEMGIDEGVIGYNLLDADAIPKDRKRIHYYTVVDGSKQMGLIPYEIEGDSQDFSNWKKTDEYIPFKY